MSDNDGIRQPRADGTILDLLPIGRVVLVAGLFIVALFVAVQPAASAGLEVPGRILFWLLHVGTGLLALWAASQLMARTAVFPAGQWSKVLVTGVVGILVAAPLYLALDRVWAPFVIDDDPDLLAPSLLSAIAGEVVELAPWLLSLWILINLPLLIPEVESSVRMDDTVERREPAAPVDEQPPGTDPEPAKTVQLFLNSLPGIVGNDVIAVSSDLHYLNVWTVAGRTAVLGRLGDVATELADSGMQVHRSHWVAHQHVTRVVGTSTSAAVVLSNQLRIPVSRRRWKSVREQYGRGVVHTAT